jgi:transcriptional regulator with XRE-family HTH domain
MLVNLRAAITARGLKQAELAEAARIAPTVMSEIIHGRRRANSSQRLRIARRLKVDEHWLFDAAAFVPPALLRKTQGTEQAKAAGCTVQ